MRSPAPPEPSAPLRLRRHRRRGRSPGAADPSERAHRRAARRRCRPAPPVGRATRVDRRPRPRSGRSTGRPRGRRARGPIGAGPRGRAADDGGSRSVRRIGDVPQPEGAVDLPDEGRRRHGVELRVELVEVMSGVAGRGVFRNGASIAVRICSTTDFACAACPVAVPRSSAPTYLMPSV